jgi:hypothetical protein
MSLIGKMRDKWRAARQRTDARNAAECSREIIIDPDSKLPVGSIIENHKGEFGVIVCGGVVLITKQEAEKLLGRPCDRSKATLIHP